MRMKNYIVSVLAVGLIGLLLQCDTGQTQQPEIEIPLVGVGPNTGATGELKIEGDELIITVSSPLPSTRFNVLLGQSATANRVPMSFIGDFTTDSSGEAKFKLEGFDVTTAFATFSTVAPDPVTGLTICQMGGASAAAPCNVVQLNALRIYFADPTPGVTRAFDGDGESGGLAFEGVVFDISD